MNVVVEEKERVFDAFRRWGYLEADLIPLRIQPPLKVPDLEITGPVADSARAMYCGTIGVEFMHIPERLRREWIREKFESAAPEPDRPAILDRLIRAKVFEQMLHTRYPGTKRYSLEGAVALIPLLDEILESAAARGALEMVLAMSHRGRLNVMVNVVGRTPTEIFAEFEDVDPASVLGGGDVKYHIGATGTYKTRDGRTIGIHLVSNPSHLEAVDPVAMGRARAKQKRLGADGAASVLSITVHGDAAFAGQGIWAETLNMSLLKGYSVHGTIHVIVNNLLGFTAGPAELHSSQFAADLAKRQSIPVFHVNAEDPDAVVRVARLALEYRYQFSDDVVIDLIGFRLHGHSEVDEPSVTQPLLYDKIRKHPPLWQLYAQKLGLDPSARVDQLRLEFGAAQEAASKTRAKPVLRELPSYWSAYSGGPYNRAEANVVTSVPAERLHAIAELLTRTPPGFHLHPKLKHPLEQRAKMGRGEVNVDYSMAEGLAFGSLLLQGVPVRLSGQDSVRGTFNQRHAALIDAVTEDEYIPLAHLDPHQAWFEILNSPLSEASVLGFEYGFSRDYPEALVLWEAQFGDFANGAQVVIDQFISAGEDKWGLLSGVVLLLPHGYEGQGPEHSSARIERFLQLAAEDNIQICQPSTASQYFYLLRRQALQRWRKPLVLFTPKGMLRHPDACSPLEEFSSGRFMCTIPDTNHVDAARIFLCSGKVGHELRRERQRRNDMASAVIFLDQLYPFPEKELATVLERYPAAREIVWIQEEPANMGALMYVMPKLERVAAGRAVRSVKRSASASPATGSAKAHELEQKTLFDLAFARVKE